MGHLADIQTLPEIYNWVYPHTWVSSMLDNRATVCFFSPKTLGDALVTFKLNTSSTGKLYFYLDEKWPQVEQTSQCQNKLDMAQYSCKLKVSSNIPDILIDIKLF